VNDEPIIIDPNSVPAQLAALLRYMLTALGSYAIGKGWIDGELLNVLTGLATVAAPAIWGMWRTWQTRKTMVTVGEAAPNSVAVVK